MSDNKVEFTTATFGGFEKKQVLDYILKIHDEKDKAEESYKKRLKDISVAFKDIENKLSTSEISVVNLGNENKQLKANMAGNSSSNEQFRQEKGELISKIRELENKIDYYKNLVTDLENKLDSSDYQFDIKSLQDEKAKFEREKLELQEASSQIGRVMLDAHNKADIIIADAEKIAKDILFQAENTIENQRVKTNQVILEHRDKVEKETTQKIQSAQQKAEEQMKHAEVYTKSLVDDITVTANETNSYLENLRIQVEALNKATESALKNMQNIATRELQIKKPDFSVFDNKSDDYTISPFNNDLGSGSHIDQRKTITDDPLDETPYINTNKEEK